MQPNREHLQKIAGVVDARLPVTMERFSDDDSAGMIAETARYKVFQVRWPVLEGVHGEGLLLEPKSKPRGWVIALPDADQTPEQLTGLAPGIAAESQFARRLVENGFVVLAPVLINRATEGSGNHEIAMTNQPHREWIYRQAYMMGRHVIGYEVQKVLAAVEWMKGHANGAKVGLAGYGEGGLIAFYAAALDPGADAAFVSGYFKSRQETWKEPIYRNVWGLLREFGDAEIASLIAPRGLVVEYSAEPKMAEPAPPCKGVLNCAAPGTLTTPPFADVQREFDRIDTLVPKTFQQRELVELPEGETERFGSPKALSKFVKMLGVDSELPISEELPLDRRLGFEPGVRQMRQVKELENHVQSLIRVSGEARNNFLLYKIQPQARKEPWTLQLRFDPLPIQPVTDATPAFRKIFWEEVIGKIDESLAASESALPEDLR